MKTSLAFRYIAYDTRTIPSYIPEGYSTSFFTDDAYEGAQSVTKEEEKQIVKWLFEQPLLRSALFEELSLKQDLLFKLEIKEPIIDNPNKKPGDIDALIYDNNSPDEVIAIECKRIKVIVEENGDEKVNKIGDIKDAVKQANALREMGFHKSYLAIFVEVDGRQRKEYNFLFRGLQKFHQVYEFPLREKLHDDVGIIFIEIVQPIDKFVNKAGAVGICVDKKAKPISQSTNLTNRIISLASYRSQIAFSSF